MELILKIEMTKLTDDAKKALAYFISISDPKPVKTELEKKLENSIHVTVNPISKEKKGPSKPSAKEKTLKEKVNDPFDLDEDETKDPLDEETSENGLEEKPALSLDLIKEKVIALRDKGKRDKTLKLMEKFQIAKLSDLEEDDFDTFYAALNNIK